MSIHKTTPGPWVLRAGLDKGENIGTEAGLSICDMAFRYSSLPPLELDADARLIIAAPELLDIVETIELGLLRGYTPAELLDENSPVRDRLRAVIAQVTGKP